jgi:cell division control protein 6
LKAGLCGKWRAKQEEPWRPDLLILAALSRTRIRTGHIPRQTPLAICLLRGVSKSTFFQSVNYPLNLGLITLIKKKLGKYYTIEAQILLSNASIVSGELRKRL